MVGGPNHPARLEMGDFWRIPTKSWACAGYPVHPRQKSLLRLWFLPLTHAQIQPAIKIGGFLKNNLRPTAHYRRTGATRWYSPAQSQSAAALQRSRAHWSRWRSPSDDITTWHTLWHAWHMITHITWNLDVLVVKICMREALRSICSALAKYSVMTEGVNGDC